MWLSAAFGNWYTMSLRQSLPNWMASSGSFGGEVSTTSSHGGDRLEEYRTSLSNLESRVPVAVTGGARNASVSPVLPNLDAI